MRTLAFLISLVAFNAVAVCYRHPFPNPTLSDGWGSTCCGRTNPHRGLDYPQASGTNIPSIADGVVRQRVYNGCLGNVVVVEHEGGIFSAYSHMLSQSPVAEGTTVTKGQVIGRVGNTGTCSYGSHLHLTIAPRVDGYWVGTTFDPNAFINARTQCAPPPCDRTAGLFTFSCDGAESGQSCVNLNEPSDPHTWNDNFLCTRADYGLRWSSSGPLEGMTCTNVTEGAEPLASAWSDNYLCAPKQSPLELSWSSAGPIAGKTCVHFNETLDLANSWSDNYLCYSQVSRFSEGDFAFSAAGPLAGLTCESVNEPSDPNTWSDNFFCSKPELELDLKWSFAGPIDAMNCENVNEPAEHAAAAWSDNFLCVPPQSPVGFSWSTAGPIAGQSCVRWHEWADVGGSWGDNFMCVTELTDFRAGPLTFSSDGPNAGETCVSVDEPLDSHGWHDDHLCTTLPLELTWSATGELPGLDCTAIVGPNETHPGRGDEFVCLPKGAAYGFTWSTTGALEGQHCVRWYEAEDLEGGWPKSWLCLRELPESERTQVAMDRDEPEAIDEPEITAIHVEGRGCSATGSSLVLAMLALARRRRSGPQRRTIAT